MIKFKGVSLGSLLSGKANKILNGFRTMVRDGWCEIGAAPGELTFSVCFTDGVVWRLNGVLASGGMGKLLKAAFRHPESGEWLEAESKARKHVIKKSARYAGKTMWYLAVPEHGVGCVPADAPEGTKVTTLKIRWTPSGRVLYSVDGQRFGIQQPKVACDRSDPVMQWLDRALIEIGEDMRLSSQEFTKYCNYQNMEPANFSGLHKPERYVPPTVAEEEQQVNELALVVRDSVGPEDFHDPAPAGDLDLPPMLHDPLLSGLVPEGSADARGELVAAGLALNPSPDGGGSQEEHM